MKVIWAEEHSTDSSFGSFLKVKFDDGTAKVFQRVELSSAMIYTDVETGKRYYSLDDYAIPDYVGEAYKFIEQDWQVKQLKRLQKTAAKIKWSQ